MSGNSKRWSAFRMTILKHSETEETHEFATFGQDAMDQRELWLQVMSKAVSACTLSLFPPHIITVKPIPHVDATFTRIMAGYLLLCETSDCVSLLYCELRSYSHGEACLAAYKDETCEIEVAALQVTQSSILRACNGLHCNIFGLDKLRFCARTSEETELWIRALMNVKTKLMCDAPDPSEHELAIFREAVLQRVEEISSLSKKPAHPQAEAMLPLRPRQPVPASLLGDVLSPEPVPQSVTLSVSVPNQPEPMQGEVVEDAAETLQVSFASVDCQVIALSGVATVSSVGVADEFTENDTRPCAKPSHSPSWFRLP